MTPFDSLPAGPASHFRLHYFGAALRLRAHAGETRFPFLADYCAQADAAGLGEPAAWDAALRAWEAGRPLPLERLRAAAGLDDAAVHALFVSGLVDEDARFGSVFETFTGHPRPTTGLLHSWWPDMRPGLRSLTEIGVIEAVDPDVARADGGVRVAPVAWDALRGDAPGALTPWFRHRPADDLVALDDLILDEPLAATIRRVPAVLEAGEASALVVRGPAAGGRRTVSGAIARATGRGMLEVSGLAPDDPRWRLAGPLASLLGALPVAVVEVAPGDAFDLPRLEAGPGTVGVVAGRFGAVTGAALDRAVTLRLPVPAGETRERHWEAAIQRGELPRALAARYRMTGGNIRRAGALAQAHARLAGRPGPTGEDVAAGVRELQGRLLETLATPVPVEHDWARVAVRAETAQELRLLEARCRHREAVGNSGVRALLSGPSGTGKTLAARTLAGVLGVDLYRIDLAAVVNKYIGETEKKLDTLFSRAEEADAALLLDEGDALMTRRTDVHSSNDRYANLETNFLLQRLETFDGVLLVTTNAGDRIDDAFRRRMDVVVDFGAPEELERWEIWRLHLPDSHEVPAELLEELSLRCALTGGQMRNAVLHAELLALESEETMRAEHLEAAVRREYAKGGLVCPLGPGVAVA